RRRLRDAARVAARQPASEAQLPVSHERCVAESGQQRARLESGSRLVDADDNADYGTLLQRGPDRLPGPHVPATWHSVGQRATDARRARLKGNFGVRRRFDAQTTTQRGITRERSASTIARTLATEPARQPCRSTPT